MSDLTGVRSALAAVGHPANPLPIVGEAATCSCCGRTSRIGENGENVCSICDGELRPDRLIKRFRIACRMLRKSGALDAELPGQKRGESPIDWLVRLGLAESPYSAAEALIVGRGLQALLDELESAPELDGI